MATFSKLFLRSSTYKLPLSRVINPHRFQSDLFHQLADIPPRKSPGLRDLSLRVTTLNKPLQFFLPIRRFDFSRSCSSDTEKLGPRADLRYRASQLGCDLSRWNLQPGIDDDAIVFRCEVSTIPDKRKTRLAANRLHMGNTQFERMCDRISGNAIPSPLDDPFAIFV